MQEIGRELGVDYVLEGSVRRAGDRVRISAQLIQVRDQTHLWAESYERDVHDTLGLEITVASAIAGQVEQKDSRHRARLRARTITRPVNPEARRSLPERPLLLEPAHTSRVLEGDRIFQASH